MKDILFDEKLAGSIHFTPGGSDDRASNGNKSGIHWDMVLRQTPRCGGGELSSTSTARTIHERAGSTAPR